VAIGRSWYDQPRAQTELETLFGAQWANGMLPHIVFNPAVPPGSYFPGPGFWQSNRASGAPQGIATSGITQPPLHAAATLEVLAAAGLDEVVLAGNSLGAAVALAAGSPRIAARVLVSPAGIIRLSVDPAVALASARWLLRPAPGHTRAMLRLFTAPGEDPPETEVEWMTLMAASCRTTLAPPPLPATLLARRASRPCVVGTGEHDRFLPPSRLAPALRRAMGLDLRILPGMGHLTTAGHFDEVVSLISEAASQTAG
jgi:pimeloyl-ACP methyl ester carboxylesterase